MNRLITEEILRISKLMEIQTLNESVYTECQRFEGDKEKQLLCKTISSLKSWVHKDDGLGLRTIINKKIQSLLTDIPEDLKQQFINGANLLKSLGKITEREKNDFINRRVNNSKLVYIDGQWQPINKLNTNYSDLAELLTDLIYKGGDKAKTFIQGILNQPAIGLAKLKPYLGKLVDKYFEDPNELRGYTLNVGRSTAIGEIAEEKVKKTLEGMGFKLEYEGGNGDLIDMVFGTDLIMTSPEYGTKTIQVKNSEYAWNRKDEYKYVDWVIIANPFTIYDNKTKTQIKL